MTMSVVVGEDLDLSAFFILTILYALFGTLGNILIIMVYVSKRNFLSQHKNILALTSVDLTICIFVMPYRILYELKAIEIDVVCRGMEIVSHATVIFSNLLLCLICVERFVKVWKPTKKISDRLSRILILFALSFSVVISFPVAAIFMTNSNRTVDNAVPSQFCQFSNRTVGELGAAMYSYTLLLLNICVLLVLVILYSLIYCHLYKNGKTLQSHLQRSLSVGTNLKVGPSVSPLRNPPGLVPSQSKGEHSRRKEETVVKTLSCRNNDNALGAAAREIPDTKDQPAHRQRNVEESRTKRVTYLSTKTSTMLFICTFIFILTWIPFFVDIFGITNSLSLRYMFFFSHASNPIVYGMVNSKVRRLMKNMIFLKCCLKCTCM